MVEALGDMEADLALMAMAISRTCLMTRMLMTTLLVLIWRKRKMQVQVDFGNVPLEWEYLNQYHGVRHPLSMTAFGPKYGLAGPPAPMFDYGFGPTGPIGGFGGPGYGYGGPGYGPGYGPGAPPAPGYGPSQGSGYGQPAQQQQLHPDQGQQTPPAPAQQSAQTQ